MSSAEYLIRVRPQRLAVLIPYDATRDQLLLAFNFLSRVWAGRHCPILPVDNDQMRNCALAYISRSRPDLVFGVGLDGDNWAQSVRDACQPAGYFSLTHELIKNLHSGMPPSLITTYPAVNQFIHENPVLSESGVALWDVDSRTDIGILYAAMFGLDIAEDRKTLEQEIKAQVLFRGSDATCDQFLTDCLEDHARFSWLNLGSYKLDLRQEFGFGLVAPPTLVLIENEVADLALFWTLRTQSEIISHFLPVPMRKIDEIMYLAKVVDWIKALQLRSNFVVVTSWTWPPSKNARAFAKTLRTALRPFGIEHVDLKRAEQHMPIITPVDSEITQRVEVNDHLVTLSAPKPQKAANVGSGRYILDLVKEFPHGRCPGECLPPPITALVHSLHAFPATVFSLGKLPTLNRGLDSVNIRCKSEERITFQLPSGKEMLSAYLNECGFTTKPDEKNTCYSATIELLGGMRGAAEALSGTPMLLLNALRGEPKSWEQLSSLEKTDEKPWFYAEFLKNLPSTARDITEKRIDTYRKTHSSASDISVLLTNWCNQAVVNIVFNLGKCPLCYDRSWIQLLDANKPLICPGCHRIRRAPKSVGIGYKLSPLVERALKEGIAPVVLTQRFLKRLTSRAFSCLPGFKATLGSGEIDLDLFAACDAYLAVGECKTLSEISTRNRVWKTLAAQFEKTVQLGRRCQAHFVVFSSLAEVYPRTFEKQLKAMVKKDMKLLLLTRSDLEEGQRLLGKDKRHFGLHDLFSVRKKQRASHKPTRRIIIGGMTMESSPRE